MDTARSLFDYKEDQTMNEEDKNWNKIYINMKEVK